VWTKGGVMGKTIWRGINPKSITPNELYGYINMATREWKDGLMSCTMRDMANAADSNPKWISGSSSTATSTPTGSRT